ncbi:permease [Acidisarcina polymorpha]|uniref:Permease n=1 Tax=Acidisarcina polymorpha TaxID=2211140 RepID=A0A2Z5FXZ4_9BACT|nr:MFS transporter [Acidisarcina polymorpha]AXC11255.1 permease [Acidisarcina polymorpha]
MDLLLEPIPATVAASSFWRSPSAWLRQRNLSRSFWIFFAAAFFFDAGFSVYFFLFNLYLLDFHFNERAIGLIGGAMTLGSVVGTLPAGMFAHKYGIGPLLVLCFLLAPFLNALRVLLMWQTAQIGLAFLSGLAMSSWGVCFLPAVARSTTEKNRPSAFSLIFSVSIGTSALGGVVCGYLPQWLKRIGLPMQAFEVKRLILLGSCGVAILGLIFVLRLPLPRQLDQSTTSQTGSFHRGWLSRLRVHPFLLTFLPAMALWSGVIAAFSPFANVYLSRDLHIPMSRIGLIFSTTQVVQLCLGLLTPFVFRKLGLVKGIIATQIATALALASLSIAVDARVAVALYLGFSAAQWMSSPGLYNLLMNRTPDSGRSNAAAMTLFCNALAASAATAGAGILFTRFGYPRVLQAIAALALVVAAMFWILIGSRNDEVQVQT